MKVNRLNIFSCFLLIIAILVSCKNKEKENISDQFEIRKVFIEFENVSDNILEQVLEIKKQTSDTTFLPASTDIIYNYYDARDLPTSNLLNGTRKIKIATLSDVDSLGNPLFSIMFYQSDNSDWRRTLDRGATPFNQDTLVSDEFIIDFLIKRLDPSMMKGLPYF